MINFEKIYTQLLSSEINERKKAVAELYASYNKKFTRQLQYKFDNLDSHIIEDIVQDSFLKIIENKKAKPKNQISIIGWLRLIVFRTALNKCHQIKSVYKEDSIDDYKDQQGNTLSNSSEFSTSESINSSDCIHSVYKKYAEKNSEEFEIFSTYVTENKTTQESLSQLYGKSLSNIKKICAQTQRILEELIEPCLE